MTYGNAFDRERRTLYHHASVWRGDAGWEQVLGWEDRWHSTAALGLPNLLGIAFVGGMLYSTDGHSRKVTISRIVQGGHPEPIDDVEIPGDGALVDIGGWESDAGTFIVTSSGVDPGGSLDCFALSGNSRVDQVGRVHVIVGDGDDAPILANPTVTQTTDGSFRAYFRRGRWPALGNWIASARVEAPSVWRLEPGARIAPQGRWANHGVGFPEVWQVRGGFAMSFTGYWGDCRDGRRVETAWRATTGSD